MMQEFTEQQNFLLTDRGFDLNSDILEIVKDIISSDNIHTDELMSRHTTFRTGGPATLFLTPAYEDELLKVTDVIMKQGVNCLIIGNGSNLLVSDKGFDGVVISLEKLNSISLNGEGLLEAQAGALNSSVALFAKEKALTGFEFAAGIPGTIGGAMIMNAGAYGGEMKQITKKVRVISPKGEIFTLDNDAMEFGYRTSAIKGKGFVVLSAFLSLTKGDEEAIANTMKELALKRKEKQPLEYPSAGSTFKRPEGYFAGKLIEDAGLKGFSVGGAAVSDKHCGFVINKGDATSADIYELIQEVKKRVYADSGVTLEPEIVMVGEF